MNYEFRRTVQRPFLIGLTATLAFAQRGYISGSTSNFVRSLQLRHIVLALCLTVFASPMFAQFSVTGISIDPTTGAQQLATAVMHGIIYIAAAASIGVFVYGIFRLVSGRPMEGVLEIALGIVVFGLIGNALNWGTALTGQAIL